MSAIPPTRQIQLQNIPGAPSWFGPFLIALNRILGPLYDMANAGTTRPDNVPDGYATFSYQVPSTGYTAQTIPVPNKRAPLGVYLAQVQLTNGTPPTGTANSPIVLNQWTSLGGTISLDSIVGLQVGCTYMIRVLITT